MSSRAGQTLIEILLAIGLAAILLPALFTGIYASRTGKAQQIQRLGALNILKETEEAVRVTREANWENFYALADGPAVHPAISGSTWSLITPADTPNGYNRSVLIKKTADPSKIEADIAVSWQTPIPYTVSSVMYLTRYVSNTSFTDTSVADWQKGLFTSTEAVTDSADGRVVLKHDTGGGDWCQPQQNVVKTFNLTRSGVPIAITAATLATQDLAYTTTGNNSSGDSVDKLTISQDGSYTVTNPNFNNEAKAYGIYTDGSYVYFNENNPPNYTVRIANASDLANVGYFDVKNVTGNSVFVLGNVGYTTGGNTLYAFDLTSKSGSRPLNFSVSLAGTGNRVVVVDKNAYVATSNPTKQLQIINLDTKAVADVNLGNGQGAVDVFVDALAKYAYVVTGSNSGNNFFIVDLADFSKIYGYKTINGMTPKGIIVPASNRAVIVGSGGELYQVFDITLVNSAFHCGGMSPSGVSSINAVSGVAQTSTGKVFSYIITDDASAEFQVIQGGSGGSGGYLSPGVYESGTSWPALVMPTANKVAFNRFDVHYDKPASTDIQFQVATADPVSGSCTNASFAYSTTYTTPTTGTNVAASYGINLTPNKCFRYKATLTGTSTVTPSLNDITINYSP